MKIFNIADDLGTKVFAGILYGLSVLVLVFLTIRIIHQYTTEGIVKDKIYVNGYVEYNSVPINAMGVVTYNCGEIIGYKIEKNYVPPKFIFKVNHMKKDSSFVIRTIYVNEDNFDKIQIGDYYKRN